jgi:hypothetical protein
METKTINYQTKSETMVTCWRSPLATTGQRAAPSKEKQNEKIHLFGVSEVGSSTTTSADRSTERVHALGASGLERTPKIRQKKTEK